MSKNKPSRASIAEYIDYDPATGIFRWKKAAGRQSAGANAGGIREHHPGDFYLSISLFKRMYPATHIAWVLMTGEWPSSQIDHRDHDTLNNKWINLRLATYSQNQMNRKSTKTASKYKGVYFYQQNGWKFKKPWVAQINHKHIGVFATAEEAARAYDAKAIELYGEFSYLNFPTERHVYDIR
jgi:hypothetical protein